MPMIKLVPESTHHVSHAKPDLCEDSTHVPVLIFENSAGAFITHPYLSVFQLDYRQKTFIRLILNSGKLSLIYSTRSSFLPQPYLRQNELAVTSHHKYPEESDELLFPNLTG